MESEGSLRSAAVVKLRNVMAALRDVILAQQSNGITHEPTPTEIFAVISNTLNTGVETEHLVELLEIFNTVIPSTNLTILRMQFRSVAICLMKIVKLCNESQPKILRSALSALGAIAVKQEFSDGVWGSVHGLQCANCFLSHIDHSKSKISKAAQDAVFNLLLNQRFKSFRTLRQYFGDFCIEVIKSCTRSEYKRCIYVVIFLEKSLALLPESQYPLVFTALARLHLCNQPILTAAVYRLYDCFFQSPYLSVCPKIDEIILSCLHTFIDSKPSSVDMEANAYYCTASASGLICLHRFNADLSLQLLPNVTSHLIESCDSEFSQIHCAVNTALKRFVMAFVEIPTSGNAIPTTRLKLPPFLHAMNGIYQLRFQHAWVYVLDAARCLFDRLAGPDAPVLLHESILKLAEIFHSIEGGAIKIDPAVYSALGNTLGSSLQSTGFAAFIKLVPLKVSSAPDFVGIDDDREWILTILQDNLKFMRCSLAEFGNNILAAARQCSQGVKNPTKYNLTDHHLTVLRTRVLQLWSLFPEFCARGLTDVAEVFPRMYPIFEGVLKDATYPELTPPILLGLTSVAKHAAEIRQSPRGVADLKALQEVAGSFMPLVLKYLESIEYADGDFSLGLQCVSAWAAIAPSTLVVSIAKKLLHLLLAATNAAAAGDAEASAASGWMAVMLVLVPYVPDAMIQLIFRTVRPLLSVATAATAATSSGVNVSLQKRAYALLDALIASHFATVFAFEKPAQILAAVGSSLLTCHVSARAPRLRCLATLLRCLDDPAETLTAFDSIFGEVLVCARDANKKARDSAMDLLKTMIHATPVASMFQRLSNAALTPSSSSVVRSSALVGLCLLLLERRQEESLLHDVASQFENFCALLVASSGSSSNASCAETTRSVLSLFRVCAAVLPTPLLERVLPAMANGFTTDVAHDKAKYLSRCRAIVRKLVHRIDAELLRSHLPAADQPLLNYVLKMNRRGKRKKRAAAEKDRAARMLGSDSDNDSEDEESDDEEKDTAANAVSQRLATRPKALRATELINAFPSSLDDLLEDRPSVFTANTSASKRSESNSKSSSVVVDTEADSDADDKEAYSLVIAENGQLVVKERVDNDDAISMAAVGEQPPAAAVSASAAGKATGVDKSAGKKRQREPGEEYRAKKGTGGDVWKKGMMAPHAYLPLDPRLLSKKNKTEAVSAFSSVVRKSGSGSSSGVAVGGRAKGNRNQRLAARKHKIAVSNKKSGGGKKSLSH